MPEGDLIETLDWIEYRKIRAEEAEADIARLEDLANALKTRLILWQEELLWLYR